MAQPLRIAIELTHPAHFHFFKNSIQQWQARGHDLLLLSRDKDITLELLRESGLAHQCLSRARTGRLGLGIELVEHSARLYVALGRHRSQVVAAIGGTFSVHAARLRGIPSLVFYDTEHAKLSNRITFPFATHILTPRAYRDDLGPRHERYNGVHALAALHPNVFTPDPGKLAVEGLSPGEPFSLIRLVAWNSNHDVGDFGVRDIHRVVERLSRFGRVLISSEAPLPPDLQPLQRRGLASDVHHVMAYARLLFGESATMATESAILGVPAIFLSTSSRGYTDELERRYQMVFNFNGAQAIEAAALDRAEAILTMPDGQAVFKARHDQMMTEQIDVSAFVTEIVERYAAGH